MQDKQKHSRRKFSSAGKYLFIALMLIVAFVYKTELKSWLQRQMMAVGFFKPGINTGSAAGAIAPAAAFSFRDDQDNLLSTADLQGKVVFINFWASWCPPCRTEMPSINRLYTRFKDDKRLVFLFITADEDIAKAKQYLQDNGFHLPLSIAAGEVPEAIFGSSLPTTVVLDKQGAVVFKHEGIANYSDGAFIAQLELLMKAGE